MGRGAQPGGDLTIDAIDAAIGVDVRDGPVALGKEIPFTDGEAIAEKQARSEANKMGQSADHARFAIGVSFEQLVDFGEFAGAMFEVVESIAGGFDITECAECGSNRAGEQLR